MRVIFIIERDMQLTQKEAEDLIALLKIPVDIGGGLNFDHLKKVVTLKSPDDREEFFLNITPGKLDFQKITYQTRARKSIILVRLDIGGPPHRNPDDEEIPCPHIHIYREGYADKWAYSLPKEFDNCKNMWDFFEKFQEFCNISINPFNQPTVTF